MTRADQNDETGSGILSRLAAAVYRYLILAVFGFLNGLPTLILWTFLRADPSNVVLFMAALVPIAPAGSAAVYALRAWRDSPDLEPSKALIRGYRLNLADTLKWWVLVLVVATFLVMNVVLAGYAGVWPTMRPVSLALLVLLGVWSAQLLVVTSLFSFRTRDAMRIAAVEVISQWKASLGLLSLMIVAVAVAGLWSKAVLVLMSWAFVCLLWLIAKPIEADVAARFIRDE
ncbi:hypothetical protein [Kribbella sp. NPDC004875]|uniref:hypothetical protein n=1 Tax=Kribbella sp. NPDC004875 TaxID=3364107 RepID=UPI0036C49538